MITRASPSNAPASGGVALSLSGKNLFGCVEGCEAADFQSADGVTVVVGATACQSVSHASFSQLQCMLAPGSGHGMPIAVVVQSGGGALGAHVESAFTFDGRLVCGFPACTWCGHVCIESVNA